MNFPDYPLDSEVFRLFGNMKLHSFFARLALRYLLTWGLETNSLSHRIALTYLVHKGLETNSLFDRLALTYVLNGGLETNSVFGRLARAYLVKRGLDTNYLFDTIARAFMHLLKRGPQTRNLFEKMALMYLLKRCDEAVHKGLSVRGFADVFDRARVEGGNLIDQNLQRISKTPMAWQTAKIAVACRSIEAFHQENMDDFRYTAELGYWTGALERLRQLEKEENSESD
uniref:ORF present in extra-plastid DNA segment n=1 Tax=Lobelia pleotricha TaxID=1715896 RepID=UPI002551D38A|nr:ORF present in extra-plastid DNA segment [Lobelia pleotricha]YP_010850139.1 ORF present in extra-plastid DNA segment [Lobelia taliensis]WGH11326.1 ORF present in extra-plastid DNA segment [Lobelia pleotricha]WGH11585.1 ORF present in extra-plastid DNA segment [Lobelia taliensis]